MKPNLSTATLAAALAAGLLLAGCHKAADTNAAAGDTATPAATQPDATMPPAATPAMPDAGAIAITSVDIGSAVGDDNRISVPGSTFKGTDTIHASVVTDGSTGGTLVATWTFQDGQVVDTQEKVVPAGAQVTDFSISKPDGWPAGNYKLEIAKDGTVLQTREFSVS
jgi:hypothetical protein